ncbi:DUF2169 domain-containing protein [Corallococcus sp. BB11-1]|uniref:DUF2169 family type VI secretion system accessory protein n=1 Tax=Corallococcus sp. BB11-1 TaxID=2996783 RepID=UPI0010CF0E3B|nr:DUF2169 domain-containing protein [Corallococcus sp. BB11-1]MCY1034644.1 DUF2169 domain-containing protein [Corallococcus sp. BB11-1]RYZ17452.1 MAG: DUF2169 domain-containing protein [Myxococcaceae bacterium]
MWALKNRTVYAAERNWTRDKDGVHWWLVAIKATFDIRAGGRLRLADKQSMPVLMPEYFSEPGRSSLRYDSDLLAVKPGTDVLVVAHAHAPHGKPAPTVRVVLRLAQLQKELLVHGERTYERGLFNMSMTRPRPFTSRPIRYELALGGSDLCDADPSKHLFDERNPLGRGFAVRAAHLEGKPAHAIEYPDDAPSVPGPAGFGPIDASWMPRRKLAGTYDARWEKTKKPLLPDDFDPAFALSSPSDQRPARALVGGERVELLNMTPEGVLRFELPHVSLGFTTRFGSRREQHGSRMTTVLLEPEDRRLSLVWQSALRVPTPEADYLDETEIVELRGVT